MSVEGVRSREAESEAATRGSAPAGRPRPRPGPATGRPGRGTTRHALGFSAARGLAPRLQEIYMRDGAGKCSMHCDILIEIDLELENPTNDNLNAANTTRLLHYPLETLNG